MAVFRGKRAASMKYFWYGIAGLFSLGLLGLMASIALVAYVFMYYGRDLPNYDQLKDYEPPIVSRLYAGDGRLMAEFAQEKRVFMPIETIPDLVKNAFISAEDKNFYTHKGVDLTAIARAAFGNLKALGTGARPKGASTITQQIAKNFLLTNELSYERKIKEAILAYRMERAMSKGRLLELYLNEIYLGARTYGVAAAALHYFDKSLDDLNIAEAAYLAALPKAPNNYHPVRHHDRALERRNWVIDRMRIDGFITKGQAALAQMKALEIREKGRDNRVRAPFFAEEVRRTLVEKYGGESLYGGGLAVRSTIDPNLQNLAEQSLRDGLVAYDKRHGWRGPIENITDISDWQKTIKNIENPAGKPADWALSLVLDVTDKEAKIGFQDGTTGKILLEHLAWARKSLNRGYALGAVVTSVKRVLKKGDVIMTTPVINDETGQPYEGQYALRQIPDVQGAIIALDPHTGRILAMQGGWHYIYGASEYNRATQAKRQPGSAFKPFVYLAALNKGFTPATLVLDAPFSIEDRPGHWWSPTNYSDKYYGPTPIRVGVEKSKNLMTVRLADYLGMDIISEYAEKFDITDHMPPLLANSLGAGETTLERITAAYASFVNGGKKVTPTLIDRIQDKRGKTIFRHDVRACDNCGDLIKWLAQDAPQPPDTREQITNPRTAYQMLSILEGVVQRGTGVRLKSLERPLAGKTGTTNDSKDAWFIGFSPDLVVGVYVGFDEPRSLGKKETGSSVAVPIFKSFMEYALKDKPIVPFRVPSGIRNVRVNAKTGARASPYDKDTIWESFLVGTEPSENIYMLGRSGIHLVRGGQGYYGDVENIYAAPYDENREGSAVYGGQEGLGYEDSYESSPVFPQPYEPYPNRDSSTNWGTGGLY
jgi:penicillin-binding protein 1A